MKIRASIHLGGLEETLSLFPILQETDDHLALKLAAYILFADHKPLIISSAQQHPALAAQDFAPDLMAVDLTHQVTLWVECGKTTPNKLEKTAKRFRQARLIVLTALPREAAQVADTLDAMQDTRVEVWTFADGEFARWRRLLNDHPDIIGEATETSMNLVVNNELFVTDLQRVRS